MLIVKGVSQMVFFRDWSNRVFHSLYFPKESRYGDHLVFQNVHNLIEITEIAQKNRKRLLVLKIIAFESGTTNLQNLEQDNCHWQSICYETPLRFNRSLRQIFSRSGSPIMMKKYDKSNLMHISQEFGTV